MVFCIQIPMHTHTHTHKQQNTHIYVYILYNKDNRLLYFNILEINDSCIYVKYITMYIGVK